LDFELKVTDGDTEYIHSGQLSDFNHEIDNDYADIWGTDRVVLLSTQHVYSFRGHGTVTVTERPVVEDTSFTACYEKAIDLLGDHFGDYTYCASDALALAEHLYAHA
jgi:hypothetical protein